MQMLELICLEVETSSSPQNMQMSTGEKSFNLTEASNQSSGAVV